MEFVSAEARAASVRARRRAGVFHHTSKGSFFDVKAVRACRNATVTTIGPDPALISDHLAGCSSGIEPLFAAELRAPQGVGRRRDCLEVLPVLLGRGPRAARALYSEAPRLTAFADEGSALTRRGARAVAGEVFAPPTTHPEWHVRLQAAFQGSTNNAVSSRDLTNFS